jgi:peptidyl-prolyl cis-trans isomerase D
LNIAFHTDQGAESQMAENGQDGYFLIRVDGVTQPAPRSLAQVKAEVSFGWITAKRHQIAKEKSDSLAAQLKGASLASVAKGPGIEVKTSLPFARNAGEASGVPSSIIGKIFDVTEGEIVSAETPDGWVVARLSQIKPIDPSAHPEKIQSVRSQTSQAIAGDLAESFLSALDAKVGVKIDRSQLTREE